MYDFIEVIEALNDISEDYRDYKAREEYEESSRKEMKVVGSVSQAASPGEELHRWSPHRHTWQEQHYGIFLMIIRWSILTI